MTSSSPTGSIELRPRERRRTPRPRLGCRRRASSAVAVLLVLAPWDPTRGQAMADQVTIWLSPSPAEISELADATGMSETGRRIFFASTPELDDADDFNTHCPVDEQIVLGCYTAREIYLYRVTDERLQGTNEVTAAHEMLHAAYERLPESGADAHRRLDRRLRRRPARRPPAVHDHAELSGRVARRRAPLPARHRVHRAHTRTRERTSGCISTTDRSSSRTTPSRPRRSMPRTRGSRSSRRSSTPSAPTSRRDGRAGRPTPPSSTRTSSGTTPPGGLPPPIASIASSRPDGTPGRPPASPWSPTSIGTTPWSPSSTS